MTCLKVSSALLTGCLLVPAFALENPVRIDSGLVAGDTGAVRSSREFRAPPRLWARFDGDRRSRLFPGLARQTRMTTGQCACRFHLREAVSIRLRRRRSMAARIA